MRKSNHSSTSLWTRLFGTREKKYSFFFLLCILAWAYLLLRVPLKKESSSNGSAVYGRREPPSRNLKPLPESTPSNDESNTQVAIRHPPVMPNPDEEKWWRDLAPKRGLGHEKYKTPLTIDYKPIEEEKPDSFYRDSAGNKQTVVVLMWDGMTPFGWGQGERVGLPNYAGYEIIKPECPLNCVWTDNRRLLHSADTLIFDVCLTGPYEHRQVPVHLPEKRGDQIWGWLAYEQQYYFPLLQEEDYMRRFEYSHSYRYDSLAQITFTCPWGMINTFLNPPPTKSKDKVVAFMGSNCDTGGAKERTAYIAELMKYIKVDSYGGCLHNTNMQDYQKKNGRRSHGDKIIEKIGIISEYKFLLAFENNNKVEDYVTEKMTNAYQAGTVPVYWGSPTVDRWTIGENSIIKTTDFPSPKELGEYLNMLNDNDEEYYKYFDWKKDGISPQYQRLLKNCVFDSECRLCQRIAEIRNSTKPAAADKLQPKQIEDTWALRFNCLDCRVDSYSEQYAFIPHHNFFDLTDEYTLSAWIQVSIIQDGRIIDKAAAGAIDGYSFDVVKSMGGPNGKLRLCCGDECFSSTRLLHPGIWYHVAVTVDGLKEDGIKFYINGKFDSAKTARKITKTNTHPVKFGKSAEGGGSWRSYHQSTVFDGLLDDIAIYKRVLPEDEIFDNMYKRLKGTEEGLVGYWGFNEGQGTIAHDSSPHQFHASLVGSPIWTFAITKPVIDPSDLER